jgi:hypothetical protein
MGREVSRVSLSPLGDRDQQLARELGIVGDLAESKLTSTSTSGFSDSKLLIHIAASDVG